MFGLLRTCEAVGCSCAGVSEVLASEHKIWKCSCFRIQLQIRAMSFSGGGQVVIRRQIQRLACTKLQASFDIVSDSMRFQNAGRHHKSSKSHQYMQETHFGCEAVKTCGIHGEVGEALW